MAPNPDFEKIRVKIIVRAWKDPSFKEKLMRNPRVAFKEMGLDIPENVKVSIVEDKANAFTFVLPTPNVDTKALSDQALEQLAGGQATVGRTCKWCPLA